MIKLDILVHPTFSEPKVTQPVTKEKPARKWRFPWRINMLASPKSPISKFERPPPEQFKVFGPVEAGVEFRSDHLARPPIRKLYENKKMYRKRGHKYVKTISHTIDKSWDSIYNYYRKKLRERCLKRLQRKLAKEKAKKPKGKSLEKIESMKMEHLSKLSMPRKLFLPEKLPRHWKPLEELLPGLDTLAAPKSYHILPPRPLGVVSEAAKLYQITEAIAKLYHIPERYKRHLEPILDGYVKKSALRAKCTPRIEKLAQPSFSAREAKKHDEDKYDPWVISENAKKYKPSARILELAKPLERE